MTTMRLFALSLSLAGLLGACKGGASGRCDAIYSKVEQMPEFKGAGFARYGNELRAAFVKGCGVLSESELKCMEDAKSADDLDKCEGGRDAFKAALAKVGQGKER
jgi:hypothetical protein